MSSTQNIAKNSLFLYFRMLINMGVGLFTAGIVLNTLGITDYGIYSIVGGFVSMFGFMNASMSSATQRFLSFDLGKKDVEQLKKTFSSTVTIHFAIAIIVVILLETIGLWYINYKLNVPHHRINAVNVIYQFSVFSAFFGIIQVPYNALITARERFNVYAYISFLEIALKLIVLYIIIHIDHDKLIAYSFLILTSSFIIRMIYRIYCRKNFKESHYEFYYNKDYFKVLLSYSGWNLFGNIAGIARGQGNNLVLNMFFGPVMNAAYGITSQVQGFVLAFVSNFQLAVSPQIVKNFASGDKERSIKLMQQSSKFSFGLMLIMVVPIIMSTSFILDLWLKNYPDKSVIFIQLCLINMLIETISNPLMIGLQATGKIKSYQAIVGVLIFLNLPISYLLIKYTNDPNMVYFTGIIISLIALFFRIYFLKTIMNLNVILFFKDVIFKIVFLSALTGMLIYMSNNYIHFSNVWTNFISKSIFIVLSIALLSYFILFSAQEKGNLKQLYINKFKKGNVKN